MKKLSFLLALGSFYSLTAADQTASSADSYAHNLAKSGAQFTAEMFAYAQRNSSSEAEFTALISEYFKELAQQAAHLLPPATMQASVKSLTESLFAHIQESLLHSLSSKTTEPEKTKPTALAEPIAEHAKPVEATTPPVPTPVVSAPPAAPTDEPFTFARTTTSAEDEDTSVSMPSDNESSALDQVKVQSTHMSSDIEIFMDKTGNKNSKGSTLGTYYPKRKLAKMENGQVYTDVVEYKAAVTPPSTDGKHVPFAQIPNPTYKKSSKKMAGGQFENIVLYGILDTGKADLTQKPASLARTKSAQAQQTNGITPGMKLAATAKLMKKQPSKNQPAQATALQQAMPESIPAMPAFAPGIQMPAAQKTTTTTSASVKRMPMMPSFAPTQTATTVA
jgi:hypothetical protein